MNSFILVVAAHLDRGYLKELEETIITFLLERYGIGFLLALLIGILGWTAFQKASTKSNRGAKYAPKISTSSRKRWLLSASTLLLICFIYPALQAMGTLQGRILGESEIQKFASIFIIPADRSDGPIEAEMAVADQGGRFTKRWIAPGDYQLLILAHDASTLRYSIAQYSKGWWYEKENFQTNTNIMDFFGVTVDKFHLNKELLPSGGEALLSLPERPGFLSGFYLLIGHTDISGTESHNVSLGMARAKEAAATLEARGVPANHVIVCSAGSAYPADQVEGSENPALDRRVECIRIPDPYGTGAKQSKIIPQ